MRNTFGVTRQHTTGKLLTVRLHRWVVRLDRVSPAAMRGGIVVTWRGGDAVALHSWWRFNIIPRRRGI